MIVIRNASAIYTCSDERGGLITKGAVVVNEDKILFVGHDSELPEELVSQADIILDASGKIVMPGLVDCHTHSVWAGSRAGEWKRRLEGESYISILEGGEGINSTVTATRAAEKQILLESARKRVLGMRDSDGVTTVEIKSGYGLNAAEEYKILDVARSCAVGEMRVLTTFLGAHIIPSELRNVKNGRSKYVNDIISNQIPACASLADSIDVFCDRGAFTIEETRRILIAGKAEGLHVKAHAEQLESTGCAKLVASLKGISADHLERLDEEGARTMAENGVVAVLLPGAQLYLNDSAPPVHFLRKYGVKIAIATDYNPGSSPLHSLWTAATLACLIQKCTVMEAFLGITRNAGLALGRNDLGWLGNESVADLVVIEPPSGEEPRVEALIQHMGSKMLKLVIYNGKIKKSSLPELPLSNTHLT